MSKYTKEDYIREFELEHYRCNSYFDNMYKVLQFSFAAIIAILVAAASLFGEGTMDNIENIRAIILGYILPVFTYVFGVMYAYNAYALSVCGKRADILHKMIYSCNSIENEQNEESHESKQLMEPYVFTNRYVTLFSYGLQLMFYVAFPLTCNIFSVLLCNPIGHSLFYNYLHFFLTALYLIIMGIIIAQTKKDFFIKQNSSAPVFFEIFKRNKSKK